MEKKILIVNYQPRKLEQWESLFKDIEGELLTATNGEEALDIFQKQSPDIIVIDPMLPKKSGFDVIKEIKDKKPDTKVVVVASVHKGVKYQTLAKNTYHVDEFIEEPVEDDVLKEKVAKVVGFSVDSKVLEELMDSEKADNKLNFSETVKPKKKKPSTKRRFEEIIEETLSGKVIDDLPKKKVKKPIKDNDDKVFTSEELFSDVINEVEESFIDQTLDSLVDEKKDNKPEKKADSVEIEIEEKLEKTLSGLKVDKKKKTKKAVIESKVSKKEEKPVEEPKAEKIKEEEKPKEKKEKTGKEKGAEYGNYLLLEKVATGGMAELFKAKRRGVQGFQKIVAIKRILPHLVENEEFVTMFIDEAKLAAQLNHPNIAQIYDLGKIEDTFYIAMEYVEGHDLRKVLIKCKEKGCQIPEPIVLFVASKVLSALDYAHRKKGLDNKDLHIVHRDISPQNIILSLEGEVKLVDFGIAKAATKASQTQAGALKGKLLYMSPEQAWGEKVDKRSDLFSLGSVMYEALTGKKCFLADSEINILEKVRNVDYTPIREINPKISEKTARIIEKALTKDINKRYQSAKEMEQDILDVLNSLPYTVNERTVAEFINALYKEDLDKINEMAERLVVEPDVEKKEKVEKVEEDVVKEEAPAEDFSISEADMESEDFEEIPDRRANTGTVVVPNPEDIEKYEKEELEKLEKEEKSNKMVFVLGAIVALIIVAVIGYFITSKKGSEKPAEKTQIAQKTDTEKMPEATQQTTKVESAEGQLEDSQLNQQGDQAVAQPQTSVLSDIEKKKQQMVEELTKKKIEEQKKKLEQQLAAQRKLIEEKKKKLEEARKKASSGKTVAETQKPKTIETKGTQRQKPSNNLTNNKVNEATPPVNESVSAKETQSDNQQKTEQRKEQVEPQTKTQSEQAETQPVETKAEKAPEKVEAPVATTPVEIQEPKVKEGDLVPLTDDVVKPVPVKKVKPKYTLAARRKRIHGTIIAQALIDENGNVVDVRVLRKMRNPFGLDKEVIKALKKWKFEPATKNGVKVKVYDTFSFKF